VRLILASASPRRAELLTAAGYRFEILAASVDETPAVGESPADYTLRVAHDKARAVTLRSDSVSNDRDAVLLAADTEVVVDGRILGKPVDEAHAAEMLRLLSGRVHDVLTAIVVVSAEAVVSDVVRTAVSFLPLTSREIEWYVDSGEPMGKAGAYAIQGLGARFIDRIDGSWANVVGLPIHRVAELLKSLAAR
jgi:septum formation protein